MKVHSKEELEKILDDHKHWLKRDCEGWENMRADLSGADLRGVNFCCRNLSGASLAGANLSYAELQSADLCGANLSGAELSYLDLRNADLRNAYARGARFNASDLSHADCRFANLINAHFKGSDLSYTDFRCAEMDNAVFSGAKLDKTNFDSASLQGADLTGAEATDFHLSRPGMNGCNLRGADLRGTDIYPDDKTLRTACITGALFTADARPGKDDKEENAGTKGNDTDPAEKALHLEDLRDVLIAYVSPNGLFGFRREEDSKGSTAEDKGPGGKTENSKAPAQDPGEGPDGHKDSPSEAGLIDTDKLARLRHAIQERIDDVSKDPEKIGDMVKSTLQMLADRLSDGE